MTKKYFYKEFGKDGSVVKESWVEAVNFRNALFFARVLGQYDYSHFSDISDSLPQPYEGIYALAEGRNYSLKIWTIRN